MYKFYFFLWLRWLLSVTFLTVVFALVASFFITLFFYILQGSATLDKEVFRALSDIFSFWFFICLNVTLLLALFIRLKYIFNQCHSGYSMKLMACNLSEELREIGYGDMVAIWRKWFMLMVWLVGACMIVALGITTLFLEYNSLFDWFSIFWLYAFIAISGYFSFIVLSARCKKVKILKC
jgi:hypothetical protein